MQLSHLTIFKHFNLEKKMKISRRDRDPIHTSEESRTKEIPILEDFIISIH